MSAMAALVDKAATPPADDPLATRISSNMCGLGRCINFQNLKACSACKIVQYCCKEHQVEHFKKEGHKIVCKGRTEGEAPSFSALDAAARKYHEAGSFRVALINYGSLLELTEQTLDNVFHPQCAGVLEKMADCYKKLGEWGHAVAAYSRVLMILDFNNDNNDAVKNAGAFKVLGQWAECFLATGSYELALDAFKKIESSAVEFFGEQSLQRAQTFMSQGNCHVEMRSLERAEVSYKLALSLEHCGQSDVAAEMLLASRVHSNYGLLLSALQRHPEAAEQFAACIDKRTRAGVKAGDAELAEARISLGCAEQGSFCPGAEALIEPREASAASAAPTAPAGTETGEATAALAGP